ncbi:hypothetical protein Taro_013039 [Colocasia esculenta]|uniref:NADPH oxidase Respiratory burst domain-containing protein n=1 Tax=Colocasia esculenta TaxID=4460 RepID=A0A843UHI9_COLES|nr:hypothetical protein [Colocasia esculenta]
MVQGLNISPTRPPMDEYIDLPLHDPAPEILESLVVEVRGGGGSGRQDAPMLPGRSPAPVPSPRRPSSIASGVRRLTTITSKVVARGTTSFRLNRTRSSAELGLRGLRFLDKKTAAGGKDGAGWKDVEKRLLQLAVGGRLPREHFGRCIDRLSPTA